MEYQRLFISAQEYMVQYVSTFSIGGTLGLTQEYIDNGCTETEPELTDCIKDYVELEYAKFKEQCYDVAKGLLDDSHELNDWLDETIFIQINSNINSWLQTCGQVYVKYQDIYSNAFVQSYTQSDFYLYCLPEILAFI